MPPYCTEFEGEYDVVAFKYLPWKKLRSILKANDKRKNSLFAYPGEEENQSVLLKNIIDVLDMEGTKHQLFFSGSCYGSITQ
ncbi:hypothetical protein [Actinomyces vulturis]|uniref:hypothetical protein n=1 Tax=Actinomyces vulturis TaxID=1857645 RepID=UPI00159EE1C2|nr:hypothetical protein [Actinomyces vulturis]